jgi:hypothetical protein
VKYLAKLRKRVILNRGMKKCTDISPEMVPFRVIALQICTSEKVFEVASLCNDTSLTASPHGVISKKPYSGVFS